MDMLSSLPESVLFTIVSSLPFKEAAKTSILSKRWIHVWRSTTNIDFNELFFVNHHSQKHAFVDFINNFLDNYQGPFVEKFSLKFSNPSQFSDTVQRCISFALQHGVRHLELDFSDPAWEEEEDEDEDGGNHNNNHGQHDASFRLTSDVCGYYNNDYGNRSLESLKLYSCEFSMSDLMKAFVGLKNVSFGYVGLNITDMRELLFNYVGNLEGLSLKRCWSLSHFDLGRNRNLDHLKRLAIERCDFVMNYLVFNAPNLRYLKYIGDVGVYEMDLSDDMEEAELDFTSEIYLDLGDILYQILMDLYSVKVLTVCSYFLQVIPLGDEVFRMHMDLNVRHLILNTSLQTNDFWGISFLLESCPSLHTLTLNLASPALIFEDYGAPLTSIDATRFWQDQTKSFKCLKTSLEVVEMKDFRGSHNELMMIYNLVKCGKVLKKMNIHLFATNNNAVRIQLCEAMNGFLSIIPKASPHLHVSIC